jgi:hypothetical protein
VEGVELRRGRSTVAEDGDGRRWRRWATQRVGQSAGRGRRSWGPARGGRRRAGAGGGTRQEAAAGATESERRGVRRETERRDESAAVLKTVFSAARAGPPKIRSYFRRLC